MAETEKIQVLPGKPFLYIDNKIDISDKKSETDPSYTKNIHISGTYKGADHIIVAVLNKTDNRKIWSEECKMQGDEKDGTWYYDKPAQAGKEYKFAVRASIYEAWGILDNVKMPEVLSSITQMLADSSNYKTGRDKDIEYLVVHYTSNANDTASDNCIFFSKRVDPVRSAHYFVSEDQIYQSVLDEDTAWSVGDGKGKYGITNSNSLSIEMCNFLTYNETVANQTIPLIRELMAKHNIPIQKVVRHYDASRKSCPAPLVNEEEWQKFKNKI